MIKKNLRDQVFCLFIFFISNLLCQLCFQSNLVPVSEMMEHLLEVTGRRLHL